MKKQLFTICLVTLLTLPGVLFAAEQEHSMAGMGDMAGMDMSSKGDMLKGMATVGEQSVDGVKAVFYLKDIKEAMAKMGMKATHHLMVHFLDAKDGKTVSAGSAAVKVKGPDGVEEPALKMMGMQKDFGVDVMLNQKGTYLFTVGTKLADGSKRQFELKYEVK